MSPVAPQLIIGEVCEKLRLRPSDDYYCHWVVPALNNTHLLTSVAFFGNLFTPVGLIAIWGYSVYLILTIVPVSNKKKYHGVEYLVGGCKLQCGQKVAFFFFYFDLYELSIVLSIVGLRHDWILSTIDIPLLLLLLDRWVVLAKILNFYSSLI